MPIYEYKCDRCDQTFEVIQKFSDQPLAVHEGCGGAVERMLTSAALKFKGSGWYVTDYARKNGGSSGAGKTDTKSDATGDSSKSKTESKPAPAKSETSSQKSDSKSDSK